MNDEAPNDSLFDTLWSRVLETWDEEKAHHAILDYALRVERLPDLAGRYRALLTDAEKGERAKKKLDGVVVAATQVLYAMKTPASARVPIGITITAALICLFFVAWAALAMFGR